MDNLYENIIPWNGANDTGKDVRLKLERNFAKIGLNFNEVLGKLASADELFALIAEELEKRIRKDQDDSTPFHLTVEGGITAMTPKSISQLRTLISEALTEEGDTSELLMSNNATEATDDEDYSPEVEMLAAGITEESSATGGGASTLGELDNVEDSFDLYLYRLF